MNSGTDHLVAKAAYYIDRACDYAPGKQNCKNAPHAKAPPKGLRMVVGDPTLRFILPGKLNRCCAADLTGLGILGRIISRTRSRGPSRTFASVRMAARRLTCPQNRALA